MKSLDTAERLAALGRKEPSFRPTLALYAAALEASAAPAWQEALVAHGAAPAGRPMLDGAALALPARAGHEWLGHLAATADGGPDGALTALAERVDPAALLTAAIALDDAALARLAGESRVLAETAGAFGHVAALPALLAAGRRLAPAPMHGPPGAGCPVCGAWPAIAEERGLDVARRLRCGRCGADWASLRLECPFCATTEADDLLSLVPEAETDRRRIDACRRCRGYIKTIPSLTGLPAVMVIVEDLASVDLDLVALERGFTRPGPPPAAPLDVRPGNAPAGLRASS
jgi:FdhE protein